MPPRARAGLCGSFSWLVDSTKRSDDPNSCSNVSRVGYDAVHGDAQPSIFSYAAILPPQGSAQALSAVRLLLVSTITIRGSAGTRWRHPSERFQIGSLLQEATRQDCRLPRYLHRANVKAVRLSRVRKRLSQGSCAFRIGGVREVSRMARDPERLEMPYPRVHERKVCNRVPGSRDCRCVRFLSFQASANTSACLCVANR